MQAERRNKKWSAEELKRLKDLWGEKTIPYIAEVLGRTNGAVIECAYKNGLGAYTESGQLVTFNQLEQAVTGRKTNSHRLESWVRLGLPIRMKFIRTRYVKMVSLDDFWKWAEKNKAAVDFSNMEPNALGWEPEWAKEKRRHDYRSRPDMHGEEWTDYEKSRLKQAAMTGKYSYWDLARLLERSTGSVKYRIRMMGLREYVVKKKPLSGLWTAEEMRKMTMFIRSGIGYIEMSEKLGRNDNSIREKVYNIYLTERLDEVRRIMGDEEFGETPVLPTVRQGISISRTRHRTRRDGMRLIEILRARAEQLRERYGEFFQRQTCRHWENGGCGYGGDCDSCTEYRRREA